MATRNIMDVNGNVIGQLTLPDDTTDAAWAVALAPYAMPPASTTSTLISADLSSACLFVITLLAATTPDGVTLTAAQITAVRNAIQTFLNIPLT